MNFNNNHDKNQTLLGASSILSSLLYTCANLFQVKSTRATYRLKQKAMQYQIVLQNSMLLLTLLNNRLQLSLSQYLDTICAKIVVLEEYFQY